MRRLIISSARRYRLEEISLTVYDLERGPSVAAIFGEVFWPLHMKKFMFLKIQLHSSQLLVPLRNLELGTEKQKLGTDTG